MMYYDWPLIINGDVTLTDFIRIKRMLADADIDLDLHTMEGDGKGGIYVEAEAPEWVNVSDVVATMEVRVDEETLNEWLADECLEVD